MDEIYQLLIKHFEGTCSLQEEERVENYKTHNKKEYEVLQKVWNTENFNITEFDSQAAWRKIYEKIADQKKPRKNIALSTFKWASAIAAVLVLGFITSTFLVENPISTDKNLITITADENVQHIKLPDGSSVWLNKTASLEYSEKFVKRNIYLKGEAYFDVSSNPNSPFSITTPHGRIQVVGTSFNVKNERTTTTVDVTSGVVNLFNKLGKAQQLQRDFTGIISKDSIQKHETSNPNFLSWKTGEFSFNDTPITEVLITLNTYYKEKLIIESSSSPTCRLTTTFKNLQIKEVIELLESTCQIKIKTKQ